MNDNYIVYCHISPSNKRYVGITSTDPEKRWNNGRGYEKNYRFNRAIKKYGWDAFKHEILASNLTKESAVTMEKELIRSWNLTDFKYGYNLSGGGEGVLSDETRRKLSLSRIGNKNCVGRRLDSEQKKRISRSLKLYYLDHDNPMLGKHHSEESLGKMRNRTFSEETRLKMRNNHANVCGEKNPSARCVVQLTLSGEIVKTYAYASLASKELGVDLSSIIKCCRGSKNSCSGYKWQYYNK